MQKRHKNRKIYFDEQSLTTEKYVIPYLEDLVPLNAQSEVLEIGCGEGGNLAPFIQRSCRSVGVDLNEGQILKAKEYMEESFPQGNFKFYYKDMYDVNVDDIGQFDLIMMRDVIEHIHDQEKFMEFLKRFLKPNGKIFFGFPPWRMPFGGHQQICESKLLSKLPFFHLLPMPLYTLLLKAFGEKKSKIESLVEIKETGISIHRFEKIIREKGYQFDQKDLYFINPNYETKFGLKPKLLPKFLGAIPFFKDFYTTCVYCLISIKK